MCSNKKDFKIPKKPSGSLSSSILDYYHQYGQNRDLEKYLRIRRSNSSKSSSDGSLQGFQPTKSTNCTYERIGKSLENLSVLKSMDKKSASSAERLNQPTNSSANECLSKNSKEKNKPFSDAKNINENLNLPKKDVICIKDEQNLSKRKKEKSYNFNMESNIEITIQPSDQVMGIMPITTTPADHQEKRLLLESSETQTDLISTDKDVYPVSAPIDIKSIDDKRPISPASSVTSMKGPLEWDSMADVGYNEPINVKESSKMALTTLERSALKKFFTQHGIYFAERDENNAENKSNDPNKSSVVPKGINPNVSETKQDDKHLWKVALKKFREKYKHDVATVSASSSLSITDPKIHSTPLLRENPNKNVSNQLSIDNANQLNKNNLLEKYCQTSVIEMTSKEVQVEATCSDQNIQSEDSSAQSHEDKGLVSVRSFEFVAPSEYERKNVVEIEPILESDCIQINYDLEQNKENVPPENKENIPPPMNTTIFENTAAIESTISNTTKSYQNNESYENRVRKAVQKLLNTDRDTITSEETSSVIDVSSAVENDLKIGVDLLNSLISSSKFNVKTKKELIRKILQRLLKTKNANNEQNNHLKPSTSEMTTTSSSSAGNVANESVSKPISITESQLNSKSPQEDNAQSISEKIGITECDAVSNELVKKSGDIQPIDNPDLSGIKPFSISSESDSSESNKKVNESKENEQQQQQQQNFTDTFKDWLQPMTHSEINYEINLLLSERRRRQKLTSEQTNIEEQQIAMEKQLLKSQMAVQNPTLDTFDKPSGTSDILNTAKVAMPNNTRRINRFIKNEKHSQINWIDIQIEHLINLKQLLMDESQKEIDNKGNSSVSKPSSAHSSSKPPLIYENLNNAKKSSEIQKSCENVKKNTVNNKELSSSTTTIYHQSSESKATTTNEKITTKNVTSQVSPKKINKSTMLKDSIDSDSFPQWNSHSNMQQWFRNRTKLQTPTSNDESIHTFAVTRKHQFLNKYEKSHGKLYRNKYNSDPIYTKPYSSCTSTSTSVNDGNVGRARVDNNNIYSRPCEQVRKISNHPQMNDAYTSITTSDGFLSSSSVSIPILNSTSNTTIHQHDSKISIGIQTNDSLKRTQPIFGATKMSSNPYLNCCPCNHKCSCGVNTTSIPIAIPTIRIMDNLKHDKQQQTIPAPMAYIITFPDNDKPMRKLKNHSTIDDMNNIGHTTNVAFPNDKININNDDMDKDTDGNGLDSPIESLQHHLQHRRPDFLTKADERRKCLNELHNLRQQRNEQRQKLLLLTSQSTIKNTLKKLPPPPLSQKRIFTSKNIRNQTKLQYKNLPEIKRKKDIEGLLKIRKNNRIITDIFNKNLQRHTLKGRTDLSNSFNVIQI